ncbi:MAG: LysE family transporter [Thermotaleaceae bacterium]
MIFVQGLLLGLTLQLSVGPVFFAVLHKSINQGFLEAFKMTIAVTLVDAFYICISFTTISALLKIQFFHRLMNIGGMAILIYFGWTYIKNANKNIDKSIDTPIENSFMYGLKLTAVNPLTVIFWSGTLGSLIAGSRLLGVNEITVYALGCLTATLLFLGIVSFLGKYIRPFINARVMKFLDYGVGIILIGFGIRLFYR